MKLSLDDFLAQNKPAGRSKLDKYIHEIFALKNQSYTLDQILYFLKMNAVEVSKSTLHHFIKVRTDGYDPNSSQSKNSNSTRVKSVMRKTTAGIVSEKPKIPEYKKNEPDWIPPPWAPKDMNIDDLI